MERRENEVNGNVGLYKGQCECGSACTRGYKAHFGVQKYPKILKGIAEKRKTAVFSQAG